MQKPLQNLLEKEMTRKEFVATLGFGAATLMGFGSLMKLLGVGQGTGSSQRQTSSGYGSSAYGGLKEG